MAKAKAVLPVPGGPAINIALPAIRLAYNSISYNFKIANAVSKKQMLYKETNESLLNV